MSKNIDTFESFQDIYSTDLLDLYRNIKEKINMFGLDLFTEETNTALVDFVRLIFDNVQFEESELFEEEEELIDLQNY